MQLDVTRITIRERGIFDLLDLGLRVMWVYAGPLLAAAALGILPLMLLNTLLLAPIVPDASQYDLNDYYEESIYTEDVAYYLYCALLLVMIEVPLATAPMTLYLGRAVFEERPSFRSLWQNYWEMFPQLFLSRVVLRTLWLTPSILVLLSNEPGMIFLGTLFLPLPFLVRPFTTEVILLERNPIRARSSDTVSTYRRNTMLHAGSFGDLFGRWFVVLLLTGFWLLTLWAATTEVYKLLTGVEASEYFDYAWLFPAVLWFVVAYATVVRFLSYLDLRIRREGWEVELRMRAEGSRLARQLT